MLAAALIESRKGWAVFPCRGKVPLTAHGCKDATRDETTIRLMWGTHPEANIGGATGAVSGRVVLDIDAGGDDTLEELGRSNLPETPVCLTGGGGQHIVFKHPGRLVRSVNGKLGQGLDVKGDGGYVILPPSRHKSGRAYAWNTELHPDEVELAPLPAWIERGANGGNEATTPTAGDTPEGRRNSTLASLAGSMRRRGMQKGSIEAALLEENKRCSPPLPGSEVRAIAKSVSRYAPADSSTATEDGFHLTDLGNSERFVRDHGDSVRYDHTRRTWLVWSGRHWRKDDNGAIGRLAVETVARMYAEAERCRDNDDERKRIASHALKSEKLERIRAMTTLAQTHPRVAVTSDQLDRDVFLLNTPTGTVDLRTGECRKHRREDLLTKLCPTAFDPKATAPGFEKFLLDVMGGDVQLAAYIQRMFGYASTGCCREHVLFMLIGRGANGKSTLTTILRKTVGPNYSAQVAPGLLFQSAKDSHPTGMADIEGTRFAVTHELDSGTRLAEGLVKSMTGGDRIKARRMRQDYTEFDPTHTLFLCANSRPVVRGSDDGIWRRLRLIPFRQQFKGEQDDTELGDKLAAEAPGVLAWLVAGARQWFEMGLADPAPVLEATAAYRGEQDVLGDFLDSECVMGERLKIPAAALYKRFGEWFKDNLGDDPWSQTTFGRRLTDRGIEPKRSRDGRYRLGIDLQ